MMEVCSFFINYSIPHIETSFGRNGFLNFWMVPHEILHESFWVNFNIFFLGCQHSKPAQLEIALQISATVLLLFLWNNSSKQSFDEPCVELGFACLRKSKDSLVFETIMLSPHKKQMLTKFSLQLRFEKVMAVFFNIPLTSLN